MFRELSPQLPQAARNVLDRPDEVARRSVRRHVANAGVVERATFHERLRRASSAANSTRAPRPETVLP